MATRLVDWFDRIAGGDLWAVAEEVDGLGDAAAVDPTLDAFRRMVRELVRSREAFEDYNRGLEQAVLEEIEAERDRALLAEARATSASRAKSRFLANVSHELRTPMNVIIGYTEMLIEDEPEPQVETDLNRIRLASRHLLSLIDDVLDISRIEAGQNSVQLDVVDIAEVARNVAGAMVTMVESNANRLVVDVDSPELLIPTDGKKIRQILLNLLSNACKFTRNGVITLTVRRDPDLVWISVEDTGSGMTEEQCEIVFEEFAQVGPLEDRKFGGAGLGLSISRRLSRLIGGDLTLRSEIGRGSVFTVT
ncbi:MAG: HAMP domain-containing sensor histidine kinase, partial [Myxococcota bacterium]